MIFRAFTSPELPVAVLDPSYSLYPELAAMQNAPVIKIKLAEKTFDLPGDILAQAEKANLLMIVRPNAPTGTLFPKETVRDICEKFSEQCRKYGVAPEKPYSREELSRWSAPDSREEKYISYLITLPSGKENGQK
jgi:aspartate/methionine/tyrosine aminotransferase